MQMCRYRAQEKGSIIETSLSNLQDLPIFVNGMLIVQALSNLIVNAIAYSDAGSTIHLDAEVDEEQVVFKVKDVGCGIPKEAQQRIFERFYRVDAARSRGQGGTGLGLSIVKHIAQVHQGTITVESEVGIGSTFTLTIPRKGSDLQSMKKRSDSLYETKGS
jgi:signal transduction histidine kinase